MLQPQIPGRTLLYNVLLFKIYMIHYLLLQLPHTPFFSTSNCFFIPLVSSEKSSSLIFHVNSRRSYVKNVNCVYIWEASYLNTAYKPQTYVNRYVLGPSHSVTFCPCHYATFLKPKFKPRSRGKCAVYSQLTCCAMLGSTLCYVVPYCATLCHLVPRCTIVGHVSIALLSQSYKSDWPWMKFQPIRTMHQRVRTYSANATECGQALIQCSRA